MQTELTIYGADGAELLTTPINEGCKWKFELMEEDCITVKFSLLEALHFGIGAYTEWNGETWVITEAQDATFDSETGGWSYELTFNHDYWLWSNKIFKYTPEYGGRETSWEWCGPLSDLCAVFLRNLAEYGFSHGGVSYEFNYPSASASLAKTVSFDSTSLLDALTDIAEAYELEWWVEGNVINLGECEDTSKDPVAFKVGENVETMSRSESDGTYANRIYVFGGESNIPARYRKTLIFDVKESSTDSDGNTVISDTARVLDSSYFADSDVTSGDIDAGEYNLPLASAEMTTSGLADNYNFGDFTLVQAGSSLNLGDWIYANANVVLFDTLAAGHYTFDFSKSSLNAILGNSYDELKVSLVIGSSEEIELYSTSGKKNVNVSLGTVECDIDLKAGEQIGVAVYCKRTIEDAFYHKAPLSFSLSGVYSVALEVSDSVRLSIIFTKDPDTEIAATLNPGRTTAGENQIVLSTGVEVSIGDYFTIGNIIEAKVPVSYFTSDIQEGNVVNGVSQTRLMLPLDVEETTDDGQVVSGGRNYIQSSADLAEAEIVEAVVVNDDIYPRFMSEEDGETVSGRKITAIATRTAKVENETTGEKETVTYWAFQDNGFEFSEQYMKDNATLQVTFMSGSLNGMTFEVLFHESYGTYGDGQWFEVKRSDDYTVYLPDEYMHPAVGDRYVLTGWDASYLGDTLVDAAEEELLEWGKEYLKELQIDPSTYTCKMMSDVAYGVNPATGEHDENYSYDRSLSVGDRVKLFSDAYFKTGSRISRIIGFEKCLDLTYDSPQYTVGEQAAYSRLGELTEKVDALTLASSAFATTGTGSGGTSIHIITTGDATTPTDRNVLSALRSLRSFLRKDEDDTAAGLITFTQGAAFGTGGEKIDADGNATLGKLSLSDSATVGGGLAVAGDATLGGEVTSGADYGEQTAGTWGMTYAAYGGARQTFLALDRLYVRMKAIFEELEIRRLSYTGGNRVASPAGGVVTAVDALDAGGEELGSCLVDADGSVLTDDGESDLTNDTEAAAYRCWLKADDGETGTSNGWAQWDWAVCKEFNTTAAHSRTATRGYVRLVTEAGEATYDDDGNCTAQAYVVLSDAAGQHGGDDGGSDIVRDDVPASGDVIVAMGNLKDGDRDQYIVERTNGGEAPSYEMYADVQAIADIGSADRRTAVISPEKVQFRTERFSLLDYDGAEKRVAIDRGEWDSEETYYYYNRVSHGGDLWLLDGIDPGYANGLSGVEPTAEHTQWTRQTESGTGPQGEKGEKGDTGADGQGAFKSTAFIRSASVPSTPAGGSYASPLPTTAGWSDGIPAEDGNPCYMSSRIFTSDGKTPQQSAWTAPVLVADTADMDLCFNSAESPDAPNEDEHPTQSSGGWHDTATEDDIWMAVARKSNGVWGAWEVTKIKGEKGDTGAKGTDGITLLYSNNPMELACGENGQVEDGKTGCTVTYTGGGADHETAVEDIAVTAVSGLSGTAGATADGNTLYVEGHYVKTETVTYTDAEGNTKSKSISVASGWVDFTCTCGTKTGVPGRLRFTVAAAALWQSATRTAALYESVYGKLTEVEGTLEECETEIAQHAEAIDLKASQADLETEMKNRAANDLTTLTEAKSYADTAAASAVADVEEEVATLTSSVSQLTVEAERISAKTKAYVGVNLLCADSALTEDSTRLEKKVTAVQTNVTLYLRKGLRKGETYRLHAELYVEATASATTTSATAAGLTLKNGSTTLATLEAAFGTSSAGVTLGAGRTIGNADFAAAADIAAGTALTLTLNMPTRTGTKAVYLQDAALLYDMEQYMLASGYDIFGHTFEVTADNFVVRNNAGLRTLRVDEEGNLVVRGTVNNETLTLDSRNADSYLLDCPDATDEGYTTRTGTDYGTGGQSPSDVCLDLLRLPTVTVLGTLAGVDGFFLPMARSTTEYIRTRTKYQGETARWLTFADMKAMVGRRWTLINNGKQQVVGLNTFLYTYRQSNGLIYEKSGTAVAFPLGTGQTVTLELLSYGGGYKWKVTGDLNSTFDLSSTVEQDFAAASDDDDTQKWSWDLPIGTTLTPSTYLSYTAGTANGTVAATRTLHALNGTTYAETTTLLTRYTGGSLSTGSSDYFALLSGSTATAGIPLPTGASRVTIRLKGGFYADAEDATTWRQVGLRLMLWRKTSAAATALAEYAQTGRLDADGNADLLELDLEEVFAGWTETSRCYVALNVELYDGERVGDGSLSAASLTLGELEPAVLAY